jgi:hypothetical protein
LGALTVVKRTVKTGEKLYVSHCAIGACRRYSSIEEIVMVNDGGKREKEVAAALERVSHLDFKKINRKLQYDNPKYWTDDRLAQVEEAYRRFLALNLLYPSETLVVNTVLDEYWHNHIVDTKKYSEDCEVVFGSILHHYPYFGLPGEDDEGENVPAFAVTERLWEEAFGSTLVGDTSARRVSRLTLDRVLSGIERADDGPDAGPKGCKNGQHCSKVIAPLEIEAVDPIVAVLETELNQKGPGGGDGSVGQSTAQNPGS